MQAGADDAMTISDTTHKFVGRPTMPMPSVVGITAFVQTALSFMPAASSSLVGVTNLCNGRVTVGSICSGLDGAAMSMAALSRCIAGFSTDHVFSCEKSAAKRSLIRTICPDVRHVFRDALEMATGSAYDEIQQAIIPTMRVEFLTMGFPCTSISPLNNSPGGFLDRVTASGGVYAAGMSYIKRHTPSCVIMENVLRILHVRSVDGDELWASVTSSSPSWRGWVAPAHAVIKDMRDLGYHAGLVHVDSSEFSVPQRRNRVYFLFIRALGGRTAIMPEPWTFKADGPVQEALIIMGRLRSPTPLPLEWFIASDYVLGVSGNAHRDLASVKWRDRHARFAD